ncbi:MAG: porin [Luteibaculaceae bacterium]
MILRIFLLLSFVVALPSFLLKQTLSAQNEVRDIPHFQFGRGIGIAPPDSMYLVNIRFRQQNRVGFSTLSGNDLSIDEVEARVRRLRLRFDGFVYDPRVTYVIQLSFTRGDMDFEDTGFPNVVRDAMIFFSATDKLVLGMGQTKLPGNRQRVASSGDLQFVDRSIVNRTFNIDRDFGFQAFYTENINDFFMVFRAAITSGEGRNVSFSTKGLSYTGRVELLPFGQFTNFGDYFESDLLREKRPKLALAGTFSRNENAIRTGGTIGGFLFERRDMSTYMADMMFKYQGFSTTSEFMYRTSSNPLTFSPDGEDVAFVVTGAGFNIQSSYLFKSNYEIAARYSVLDLAKEVSDFTGNTRQYMLGVSRYVRGHRLKLQADIAYEENIPILLDRTPRRDAWIFRFQIEMGI